MKLHKPEHPIHPVVNWREALAYKPAQLFTQKIRLITPLPNTHTIGNTRELIKKLVSTPILPSLIRYLQPIHQCPCERNQRYHR